jgi:hypothetical protein
LQVLQFTPARAIRPLLYWAKGLLGSTEIRNKTYDENQLNMTLAQMQKLTDLVNFHTIFENNSQEQLYREEPV